VQRVRARRCAAADRRRVVVASSSPQGCSEAKASGNTGAETSAVRIKIGKTLRVLGWITAVFAVLGLVAVLYGLKLKGEYVAKAEAFPLDHIGDVPQRSVVLDANGELYSHLPGMNRQVVEFGQVSGWFVQALLAREDSRFWQHHGVDLHGIIRAAVVNLRGGGVRQGASTITQQLARNAFDLGGRTYQRKALEAALASRIEQHFTKKQILELYMNRVYFGAGLYGIEAAARGYFGKPAAELNLGESAILAGLICSPNRFSPATHPELAMAERDEVLARMLDQQMVSKEDVAAAKATRVETMDKPAFPLEDDYVTDAVNRGLAEILDREVIERGGLRVRSTIDPQLQKEAEDAADRRLTEIEEQKKYPHPKRADFTPGEGEKGKDKPTDYLQAAVVVVDNRTGAIRACVGGRDWKESKYHRALLSLRQIGSTFKPFVYAAAFDKGLLPGTLVSDDKIGPKEFPNIPKKWSPENSDNDYLGLQPAAIGLIKSRNTMSVRVGEMAGLPAVRKLADSVGIGEKMPEYPVAFLGAFETTLRDLTAAYTAFPNGGAYRKPHLIASVENEKGEVIYQADTKEHQVMRPEIAWMVTSCLQEVMRSGTAAKAAQLGWKKVGAGKTGTTNDFHDAWFVGYTQSLTCGVWVGMDKPETIMEKGYGSALALPIWVDVMQTAPEKLYPAGPLRPPSPLTRVRLCSATGAVANGGCEAAKTAYETELPATQVPPQRCTLHTEAPVPAATLAVQGAPQAAPSYPAQTIGGPPTTAAPAPAALVQQPQPMNVSRIQPAPGYTTPYATRVATATEPPRAAVETRTYAQPTFAPPPSAPPTYAAPVASSAPAAAPVQRTAPPLYLNGTRASVPATAVAPATPVPRVITRRVVVADRGEEDQPPPRQRTVARSRAVDGVPVARAEPVAQADNEDAPAERVVVDEERVPTAAERSERKERSAPTEEEGADREHHGFLHRLFSPRR